MKKIIVLILVAVMLATIAVPVMAEGEALPEFFYDFTNGKGNLSVTDTNQVADVKGNKVLFLCSKAANVNPRVTINSGYINKIFEAVYYEGDGKGAFYFYGHVGGNMVYVLIQDGKVTLTEDTTELGEVDSLGVNKFVHFKFMLLNGYACVKTWEVGKEEPDWQIVARCQKESTAPKSQTLIDYAGGGSYLDDLHVKALTDADEIAALMKTVCRGQHTYDNNCDTTCNVCGAERTAEHSYKTEWSKDADKHWHECEVCGDKKDEAAHNWDAGVITTEATVDAEGVKTYTCADCGATKTEAVPKLEKTDDDQKEDDKKDDAKGGCQSVVATSVGFVTVTAVAAAAFVLRRKEN